MISTSYSICPSGSVLFLHSLTLHSYKTLPVLGDTPIIECLINAYYLYNMNNEFLSMQNSFSKINYKFLLTNIKVLY